MHVCGIRMYNLNSYFVNSRQVCAHFAVQKKEQNKQMEAPIVGICESMCPSDEIKLRTRERLLHFYERQPSKSDVYVPIEAKVVKEFARSAAGVQTPRPHSLRTKKALKRTVTYLLTDIIRDDRKPFHFAYDFIFDRLRAVRQEIVMQDFDEIVTIELIEPMIMFLAYSLYRLVDEPIDRFDPKICRQHLQECLKKVLRCYDVLNEQSACKNHSDQDIEAATIHRGFIESLYLLLNLGSSEAMARAIQIPKKFRTPTFNSALKVALSFWTRNFYKCLVNIIELPYILCAIASLHVQSIRRDLMQCFSVAYQNKVFAVPLDWLTKIMLYNSWQQLNTDLNYYGLVSDTQTQCIRFQRDSFLSSKPIMKSRKEHFVDCQLNVPIEDLLLFDIFDS